MKRLIAFIMIIAILFIFVGCSTTTIQEETSTEDISYRFEFVYREGTDRYKTQYFYYRDIYTDVMYIRLEEHWHTEKAISGFTALLNADGTPMLYDEFMEDK